MNIFSKFRNFCFFLSLLFYGNITDAKSTECTTNDYRDKVMGLPSQLELRYNNQVQDQIDFFVEKNKKLSSIILGRATMYFPLMETTLAANNLPDELKYLPVLETALVPYLTSSAGAGGLWQFMKPTAEQFGLKVTNTIDERRDTEKSTQAACIYLKRLYKIYNDWTLVLAAYNCGDGTLNNAMKKTNSRSYWDIQQFLPQQTQEFVPKFIAISYMMNYYYEHNLVPLPMEEDYVYTASVQVFDKIDLEKVAIEYQIDMEVMRRLNAVFVKGFIPASNGEHFIHLPESKFYDFVNNNNLLDKVITYSPASITRQKTNDLIVAVEKEKEELKKRQTSPFQSLPTSNPLIYASNNVGIRMDEEAPVKIIKLTKGKSLRDIAKENNTDLASLMELNNISSKFPPRIGDNLKVRI